MNFEILNVTSDPQFDLSNNTSFSSRLIIALFNCDTFFVVLEFAICTIGLVLNSLTYDTANQLPDQTSGTMWIRFLAVWDNMALLLSFLRRLVEMNCEPGF